MNSGKADLHIHTTASDGTWGPEQLVGRLKSSGISLFAVTDHDSTENIDKVAALARENRIGFIPGVETTVSYNGLNYHILGLGINHVNKRLQSILKNNRTLMEQINIENILYLETRHECVSLREYEKYAYNRERGGWKSLNYSIDKGLCSSYTDFFSLFKEYTGTI